MDRATATRMIDETFSQPFDEGRYKIFTRNLFNRVDESKSFSYQGHYIPDAFKDHVRQYKRIGTYTDPDHMEIDVLIVYLRSANALDHARTMQRNFVVDYLKKRGQKDAAVVAYVGQYLDDWRFSLVVIDYQSQITPAGKVKVMEELTPARRYSFLVGRNEPNHTARQQLFPILEDSKHDPTLASIEAAFNIESVTKEFFDKYKGLFLQIKEELDYLAAQDHSIKAEFDRCQINTIGFAKKLLGQLVFLYFLQKKGWLGVTPGGQWGTGSKNYLYELFRKEHKPYQNFFNDILEPLFYEALAVERKDKDSFFKLLDCRIPFLNGGLFEPIGGYDWRDTDILIRNEVFQSIFETFNLYNFTVREDEPLEREVAVDPEMLGKVFENLLEVQDRKSKGAFYTPREIVHYMCQESLINYLDTALNQKEQQMVPQAPEQTLLFGEPKPKQTPLRYRTDTDSVPREDIELLIRQGEFAVDYDAAKESGTTSYTWKLPDSIRSHAGAMDQALVDIRICDPAIGSGAFPVGMMTEIVKARRVLSTYLPESPSRTAYNFKRQAIENSIYGVDIDPSAIDIARLRLWLSLVVDEEDFQTIKPLPNLDYKIVCGNSLQSVKQGYLAGTIEELKAQFQGMTKREDKVLLKREIDRILSILTERGAKFDFKVYFSEVFREFYGFDVVIGNPPYIDSEEMVNSGQKALRDYIVKNFHYTKGNWDIYIAFFEMGLTILNKNGTLTFITPDKWVSKPFGSELRKNTLQNLYSIFIAGRDVFTSVNVDSIVTIFTKKPTNIIRILQYQDGNIVMANETEKALIKAPYALDFLFSKRLELISKIDSESNRLRELALCENACATSDAYKLKPLIQDFKSASLLLNDCYLVINTGTIGKYLSKWGYREMVYLGSKYLFPVVNKSEFMKEFRNTYQSKTRQPKIIIKGLTLLDACLDVDANTIPGKTTLIICHQNRNLLKYLLAFINSKLAIFLIKEKYSASSYNGGINFTKDMINDLPLPDATDRQKGQVISIVDEIIRIKKHDPNTDTSNLEAKIDKFFYEQFQLTSEEVDVIEGYLRKD